MAAKKKAAKGPRKQQPPPQQSASHGDHDHCHDDEPTPEKRDELPHLSIPRKDLEKHGKAVSVVIDASGAGPSHRYVRADIEILGLDHSGATYDGLIFFNNKRASAKTPRDESRGFAGLYRVFGHANPRFLGELADREWVELSKLKPKQLPVENHGGPGTEDSHWRETVFGSELMTGFISGETQPLSRMTIASLADLGYQVNMDAADVFELPSHLAVRAMGIGASPERVRRCSLSNKGRWLPVPKRLPQTALL
jgi:hypothetical protein